MDSLLEDQDLATVHLKSPVDLNELVYGQGMTFEINYDKFEGGSEMRDAYTSDDYMNLDNLDSIGLHDEETFDETESFESLAAKMFNVDEDGYVKKRIIRKGKGDVVPPKSVVYIHYNGYLEYNGEPFDSTYQRKKEHFFRLGIGDTIVGLDLGIKTMTFGEKAQFLITHEYAYGKLGCFGRVPKCATVLFEVELLRYVDSGAAYDKKVDRNVSEMKTFGEVYYYAAGLCESGNDLIKKKQNYKAAIKDYNLAMTELERSVLSDYDEQVKQQKLLLRIRTNLAVCYVKIDKPKQTCNQCNRIFEMCRGTSLEIPTKVFYNNAKALIMLNDLDMAEKRLRQAANRKRDDPDIVKLFLNLNKLKEEKLQREKMFSRLLVGGSSVSEDFKKYFQQLCSDLLNGPACFQYTLPSKLTKQEEKYIEEEANKNGLIFNKTFVNKEPKIFISKPEQGSNSNHTN